MLQYTKRNIAGYDLRIQYCSMGCLKHVFNRQKCILLHLNSTVSYLYYYLVINTQHTLSMYHKHTVHIYVYMAIVFWIDCWQVAEENDEIQY